jgi:hypothetical protein
VTALSLAAFLQNLFSQFDAVLDLSSSFDDNIYLSPEKTSDLISDADLTLEYNFKDSASRIYYNPDYISFLNTPARNILLNKLGFSHYGSFGEKSEHHYYLGGYWQNRLNRETYNFYNFNQFYGYANQRFQLNNLYLRTGYNFRYRSYPYLIELSNFQHYLFLQVNRTFRTRTSLILETDWGYKSFRGTETYVTTTTGQEWGRNRPPSVSLVEEKIPSMSHVVLLARIAQSLHDRVGIYVQYRGQYNLTTKSSFSNSGSYFQDEELFDDPFSYRSTALSSRLTVILPKSVNIQVGGSLNYKDYMNEQSYLSAEDTLALGDLRVDTKKTAYLKFSKTFYLKSKLPDSIKTYINYYYVNNESNSYWYEYNYHYLGIGMTLNF